MVAKGNKMILMCKTKRYAGGKCTANDTNVLNSKVQGQGCLYCYRENASDVEKRNAGKCALVEL